MKKLLTLIMLLPCLAFSRTILSEKSTVTLMDSFNDSSVAKVMVEMLDKDLSLPKTENLNLVLYSPGGSIQAGVELIDFMEGLSRPVNVICIFCASMGFQTLQNATGKRIITNYGTAMAHKARGGFQGEFPGQIDSRLEYYKRRLTTLDKQVVKRTNGKHTLASYRDLFENEYWCDGQECVNQGFADSVDTIACDESLNGSVDREFKTIFGMISVSMSKCPLITGILDINSNGLDAGQKANILQEIKNARSVR